MKNVVIAGSVKLQDDIKYWRQFLESRNYHILDYPMQVETSDFMNLYPIVYKKFFKNIERTDILLIMNEDRNDQFGYIGYEVFAELTFGIMQKLIYNKEIEIIILKMPSSNIKCYDDINLYLQLGWIKLFTESSLNK